MAATGRDLKAPKGDGFKVFKDNEDMKVDYTQLFPGVFKYEKDIVRGPSVSKLRGDDVDIMKSLIDKYDDDFDAMFKDIKLNYLQWSKTVLKTKHKAYYSHNQHKEDRRSRVYLRKPKGTAE